MATNSSKFSGRKKKVMWKSCSRATKPLLQIKLHGSEEGRGGGRETESQKEQEKELLGENKGFVVWHKFAP